MKGVVFIALNELVEKEMGLAMWEDVLNKAQPESEGIYVSVEEYPDEELFKLVSTLSELSNLPAESLVKIFGEFLFSKLSDKYPVFIDGEPELFGFLKSIEDTIHKEVRKLYENPNLPTIRWEQNKESILDIYYSSPRKLCVLAEGLIFGAANRYNKSINLEHLKCQHRGDKECLFRITQHD